MSDVFKLTNNNDVLVVEPVSHQPEYRFVYISDNSGNDAGIYLSPTQVQELINHLTKTTNTMQPNLQQPLTPAELFALATLPPDICEAIQKLLIQKRNITMDQLPKSDGSWNAYTIKEVFEQKGWKVAVDVPGYNESYSTTLVFSY
jgi:hypothetical protein